MVSPARASSARPGWKGALPHTQRFAWGVLKYVGGVMDAPKIVYIPVEDFGHLTEHPGSYDQPIVALLPGVLRQYVKLVGRESMQVAIYERKGTLTVRR